MAKKNTSPCELPAVKGVVQFEPCMAPVSKKRDVAAYGEKASSRARFTLRSAGGDVFVFGADDVEQFGQQKYVTRLNSIERYADAGYLDLYKVLLLHLFAKHRGTGELVRPTGVVSVPISVYNEESEETTVGAMRQMLIGVHEIEDQDGCKLKIALDEKRLLIIPESIGALYHYAYDHKSLKARPDADPQGNVLVVDVGYLTTDLSLHTNMKYVRDLALSVPVGMGKIAQDIGQHCNDKGWIVDISMIDKGLRTVAETDLGAPKYVLLSGAFPEDISRWYDHGIRHIATMIRDAVMNNFRVPIAVVILTGGGAFHLHKLLTELLPVPVITAPDAALANCLGAFTRLRLQAQKAGATESIIFSIDGGNGTFKGISTETL